MVESADVVAVTVVPADYQLDGSSPFALDLDRRAIEIELADCDGRRLVDATLGISGDQTAWDRANPPRDRRPPPAAHVGRLVRRALADD